MKLENSILFLGLISFFVIITGCCSKDEVSRVTTPDTAVDVVLMETSCGATTSFGYLVYITAHGASAWRGAKVAHLYGVTRNNSAYGVNLRWLSPDNLSIEYLNAQNERLEKSEINCSGRDIRISLKSGTEDPTAPAGGMLWNLYHK